MKYHLRVRNNNKKNIYVYRKENLSVERFKQQRNEREKKTLSKSNKYNKNSQMEMK